MKAEFINPFLHSIVEVLSTMAQMEVRPGKPRLKQGEVSSGDVSGLIGLTGSRAKGSLAISFTEPAILEITRRMVGEEVTSIDGTVRDMVGEITNMVTGGAKRRFSEQGYDFDLAIPGVVAGKNHVISHKTDGTTIVVPFATDQGDFFVEICFE